MKENADKQDIDNIVRIFFDIFTNTNHKQPDWTIIHTVCIPQALIIKKSNTADEIYSLDSFIEPRKKILSGGTLAEFEEKEISEKTFITGNIAQRYSKYIKSGYLNGTYFKEHGHKLFQFMKTNEGWNITSLIWEDNK